MKDKRKKRAVALFLTIFLTLSPCLSFLRGDVLAQSASFTIQMKDRRSMLTNVSFDFFGERIGSGIYYWMKDDGSPLLCVQQHARLGTDLDGAEVPDKISSGQYFTSSQYDLVSLVLQCCGMRRGETGDLEAGDYLAAQAAVWGILSPNWIGTEQLKQEMEGLYRHVRSWCGIPAKELTERSAEMIDTICQAIEENYGDTSRYIPSFASKYEEKAPIWQAQWQEDGTCQVVFERGDKSEAIKDYVYQMPDGWSCQWEEDQIVFTCGQPENGMIAVTGTASEGSLLSEAMPIGLIYIAWPSVYPHYQHLASGVDVTVPLSCYFKIYTPPRPEDPGSWYLPGGELYRHQEDFAALYGVELEKRDGDTGDPLEGVEFQVLERFDAGQLEGTILDKGQLETWDGWKARCEKQLTGEGGRLSHWDKKTYHFEKTYCGGHPDPEIVYDGTSERVWEQLEEEAWEAWESAVSACAALCDYHAVDGSGGAQLEAERDLAYDQFTALVYGYTFEETAPLEGYLPYGSGGEDPGQKRPQATCVSVQAKGRYWEADDTRSPGAGAAGLDTQAPEAWAAEEVLPEAAIVRSPRDVSRVMMAAAGSEGADTGNEGDGQEAERAEGTDPAVGSGRSDAAAGWKGGALSSVTGEERRESPSEPADERAEGDPPGEKEDCGEGALPGGGEDREEGALPGGGEDREEGALPGEGEDRGEGALPGEGEDHEEETLPGEREDRGEGALPGAKEDQEGGALPGATEDKGEGAPSGAKEDWEGNDLPGAKEDQGEGVLPGAEEDQREGVSLDAEEGTGGDGASDGTGDPKGDLPSEEEDLPADGEDGSDGEGALGSTGLQAPGPESIGTRSDAVQDKPHPKRLQRRSPVWLTSLIGTLEQEDVSSPSFYRFVVENYRIGPPKESDPEESRPEENEPEGTPPVRGLPPDGPRGGGGRESAPPPTVSVPEEPSPRVGWIEAAYTPPVLSLIGDEDTPRSGRSKDGEPDRMLPATGDRGIGLARLLFIAAGSALLTAGVWRKRKQMLLCLLLPPLLSAAAAADVRAEERAQTGDETELVLYMPVEEDGAPPQRYLDEQGQEYVLYFYRPVEKEIPETRCSMSETRIYRGLEDVSQIPGALTVEQPDAQDGRIGSGQLAQSSVEEIGSYWTDDLLIPVVFHEYDADQFELQGIVISKEDALDGLQKEQAAFLTSLGCEPGRYEIREVIWDGESYMDQGVLCRRALATGQKRLTDHQVRYEGTIVYPAAAELQWEARYRLVLPIDPGPEESEEVLEVSEDPVPEAAVPIPEPAQQPPEQGSLWRAVRSFAAYTVSLAVFLPILFFLVAAWRKRRRSGPLRASSDKGIISLKDLRGGKNIWIRYIKR